MATLTTPTVLNKFFLMTALAVSTLAAKDVPIVESLTLEVSSDKAVIEFPFKITTMSADEFQPSAGGGAPNVKKGENVIELSSTAQGRLKTIIWGYDHPIFLDVVFSKGGEKYYKFTPPVGRDEDIKSLESNAHEDVVVQLVVAAYNEKMPKGYSVRTKKVGGKSGEIIWDMQLEYVGNEYAVQSWKVTNTGKEEIELYEEMFASEKNKVYGISIEAPRLKPNEATRVFIVKKA